MRNDTQAEKPQQWISNKTFFQLIWLMEPRKPPVFALCSKSAASLSVPCSSESKVYQDEKRLLINLEFPTFGPNSVTAVEVPFPSKIFSAGSVCTSVFWKLRRLCALSRFYSHLLLLGAWGILSQGRSVERRDSSSRSWDSNGTCRICLTPKKDTPGCFLVFQGQLPLPFLSHHFLATTRKQEHLMNWKCLLQFFPISRENIQRHRFFGSCPGKHGKAHTVSILGYNLQFADDQLCTHECLIMSRVSRVRIHNQWPNRVVALGRSEQS